MAGDPIKLTRRGRVAEVMLDRPARRNAMDHAMMDALAAAGARLAAEADLAAVILHGAEGAFCSGLDTSLFATFAGDLAATRAEMLAVPTGEANRFQRPCTVWAEVPVPVIAAISGPCLGAGLQLALGADLRLAAADASLSVMEAKWGLVPDMGLTQSLPRLMPADRALELMLTARVVTGDEAAGLGLVTRLARDPLAEARALAERLCTVSPEVLRGAKRLVAAAWWRDPAALRLEAEVQAALMGGANQIEAVSAAMQRRPARFGGAAASAPVAPARGAVPD